MSKTLADLMGDYDRERIAEIEQNDTADRRAAVAAKAEAERQRLIEQGIITEDGEPGPNADVADDEGEEE